MSRKLANEIAADERAAKARDKGAERYLQMQKIIAKDLVAGSKIMPPERELRLWMRRACSDRDLPETALALTVTKVEEAEPDKKGRWLKITALYTPEWLANYGDPNPDRHPFRFKCRPETRLVPACGGKV